jgi:hypothetical protein
MTNLLANSPAWIISAVALASGFGAHAGDQFKILDAKQIRARVVGQDLADGPQ